MTSQAIRTTNWYVEDPRIVFDLVKDFYIVVLVKGAVYGAHVHTKHEWFIHFLGDEPQPYVETPPTYTPKDINEGDDWPGYKWTMVPKAWWDEHEGSSD